MPVVVGRIEPHVFKPGDELRLLEVITPPSVEARLDVLERQVLSIRRVAQQQGELLDTIATPPWKRLLFFLQGYKLWSVGRWYGKG